MMLRKEKGFTLIELLIVVAIIGIIAAIAVPNLLMAIQRSKEKRSMADLRTIGTALGSYQVDYNKYPTNGGWANFSSDTLGGAITGFFYYKGSVKDGWNTTYQYISTGGDSYTLCSKGKGGAAGGTAEFERDMAHVDGVLYESGEFLGNCGL